VVTRLLRRILPGRFRRMIGRPLRRIAGWFKPNPFYGPGTPEEAWASWPALRRLPVVDPRMWASVAVIAPHPDDEILGTGGMIALLAAAGVRLRLIAITDGEASYPDDDPVVIAQTRAAESAAAREALGARDVEVIRLRMPDTGVAQREGELADELRDLCAGFDVCLAPWVKDAHPDHAAAGRAAQRVCQNVLYYPIWMWHWAKPGDRRVPWRRACQIALPAEAAARKRSAIEAFTSQLADRDDGSGPILPPGFVAHFTRTQEILLR
jgi:LmbE family N-acetylglucosaminyl deacetylase